MGRPVAAHVHLEAEADVRRRRLERFPEDLRAQLRDLDRHRRLVPIEEGRVPQAHDLLRHVSVCILERGDQPELARLVDDGAHQLGPRRDANECPLRRRDLLLGDAQGDDRVHDAAPFAFPRLRLVRAGAHVLHVAKEGKLGLAIFVHRKMRLVVYVVIDERIVQVGKADQLARPHRLVEEDLLSGRRRHPGEGDRDREKDGPQRDLVDGPH